MQFASWLVGLLEIFTDFIPRHEHIVSTHRGVKYFRGSTPVLLEPGVYWYLPYRTEIETVPVVRQDIDLEEQYVVTKDNVDVAVQAVVIYEVTDVLVALTEQEDHDENIQDVGALAVYELANSLTFDELRELSNDELLEIMREKLGPFGVTPIEAGFKTVIPTRSLALMGVG